MNVCVCCTKQMNVCICCTKYMNFGVCCTKQMNYSACCTKGMALSVCCTKQMNVFVALNGLNFWSSACQSTFKTRPTTVSTPTDTVPRFADLLPCNKQPVEQILCQSRASKKSSYPFRVCGPVSLLDSKAGDLPIRLGTPV